MNFFKLPLIIRGKVIEDNWVDYPDRFGGGFQSPDPHQYVHKMPLANAGDLEDLQSLTTDDILDVLEKLGQALNYETNPYIRQAYEEGLNASNYPASILKASYTSLPMVFNRETMREIAEQRIGVKYLDGWVPAELADGRIINVRAFGARALHIPAGNGGLVSAVTIIRNALTRSDAIIKIPSNDPFTAYAIVRTLIDIAPDHPVTKHLTVAYWKGGDEYIEKTLYRPECIEKLVAWGGFASIKHVSQYIQPGLELISLDPKRSMTIIGPEALADEETMRDVAKRAACDVGQANQEACASARILYVLCDTDPDTLKKLNKLGELIYEEIISLPDVVSTKPKTFDRELRDYLDAGRLDDTFYRIIGGENDEGAVIVSQIDEPVDYSHLLSGRVANLVPVESVESVVKTVNSYTQTVGIYPESLKKELRDRLPLYGAQRLTSLGYALNVTVASPQDAIEPVRRMCKWIFEEECDPEKVFPHWKLGELLAGFE